MKKTTFEGHDGELGRAGLLVDHAAGVLFFGDGAAAALLVAVPHEHGLVGVLVGARAARHRHHLSATEHLLIPSGHAIQNQVYQPESLASPCNLN